MGSGLRGAGFMGRRNNLKLVVGNYEPTKNTDEKEKLDDESV